MDGFERTEADIFFAHDSELQGLLLSLSGDDQVVVRLLDPQVDGVLLRESLKNTRLWGGECEEA